MVSADEFYRQTNKNFEKVFDKIDSVDDKVNKLQSAYNSHIAVGKALEKSKNLSTRQKIAITIGIVPIAITVYALFS